MTSFQKIIKYGAIGFAIYLSFIIIGMILSAITAIFGISMGFEALEKRDNLAQMQKLEQEYTDISNIDMDLSIAKLNIKKGNTFKVEVLNFSNQFQCEKQGNELKIKDKKVYKNFWNMEDGTPEVTITIPENTKLEEVKIKTGVNETNIEYLEAKNIDLEMGVGKYSIHSILAKYAKIEAGAGEASILQANFGELKLRGGIRKISIKW